MLDWLGNHGSIIGERTNNTLFRDVLMAALGTLMAVLIIIIWLINPPKQNDEQDSRSRGNIRIEIIWPQELNVDIDSWGRAPGDTPVGYSNLNGRVFNLVRDDLGTYADLTEMNYEVMFSRGIPKGEWIFNLHWFSNAHGATQVPVRVLITIKKNDDGSGKGSAKKVLTKTVLLTHEGQEVTVIRFETDEEMNVIKESFRTDYEPLRVAEGSN